jgi:hypothetical protein
MHPSQRSKQLDQNVQNFNDLRLHLPATQQESFPLASAYARAFQANG